MKKVVFCILSVAIFFSLMFNNLQIFAYEYVDSSIYEEVAMNFLDSQYSTNHISYDNLTV